MKANSTDLRERIVAYVKAGGAKTQAARLFKVCRKSVYNYLAADKAGTLAPKTSWGRWRKLDPEKLAARVKERPDATLWELQTHFKVSHHAVWKRLRQLGITLKKKSSRIGKRTRCSAGCSRASWRN
jgi:transposase